MSNTTNMPAATPYTGLVTVERFRVYTGVPTGQNSQIDAVIAAASEIVCRLCDIDFKQATRTEYRDGRDSFLKTSLTLMHRPVQSIASISLKCTSDESYTDVGVSCYTLDPDRGTLHGRFPRGIRNVKVVYVGGYAEVPYQVQQAVLMIAKSLLDSTKNDATMQSEKIGDYSYTKMASAGTDAVPPAAAALLRPFMSDPF